MPFYKSVSFRLSLIAGLAIIIILSAAGYFLMLKADTSIGRLQDAEIEARVQTVRTTIEIYNDALAQETARMSAVFGEFFTGVFTLDEDIILDINGTKAPALFNGGGSIAGDYSQVDAFSETTGGTATIFARNGDDFVRVVTSVKKADGQRAIGTLLSRESPAYASIMDGEAFNGKVMLFGKRFITNYTPIADASGRIIGIRYVGTAYAAPLAALVKSLSSRSVGDTGHIFILDASEEAAGNIVYHPTLSGNALTGLESVNAMLADDGGALETAWPDSPQEPLNGYYLRVPDFQLIVGAVIPVRELNEPIAELQSIFALTALIVTLITGIVLTAVSTRLVRQPLAAAIDELSAIAAGDYTRTIAVKATGEMGLLQSAMATMQQQVKKVVHEISDAAQELAGASQQLAVLSKGIAEGSREQKDAAASMASAIEELTTNIEQLSQGAEQAQNLSEESQEASEHGATIIRGANKEMQHIASTVRSSSQDITKLYEISEQVVSTIQVIQNIAEQTNLLALNAAIESARAGEAGRGFAVVADEVRGLAGRTSESAKQITDMIERMREGTKAAVSSMEENLKGVESAAGMAKAAGDSIGAIQTSAGRVFEVFSDISVRLQEQSKANEYVARHVNDIGEKATNNDRSVQEVVQSARALESMAERLQGSVAQFRTG